MSRTDRCLIALVEFNSSEFNIETSCPRSCRWRSNGSALVVLMSLAMLFYFYESKLAFSRTTMLEIEAKSCDRVVDLKDKAIKTNNNEAIFVGL